MRNFFNKTLYCLIIVATIIFGIGNSFVISADDASPDLEAMYGSATIEDLFRDDQIIVTITPDFNQKVKILLKLAV